ncbi:MAG: murein biosynthesis integral membrane protein MurJ [Chromatiaceae bacterium]|nr:murein biosynthesis integral membrane protein MurJ [Chromatiaceae bacterium]
MLNSLVKVGSNTMVSRVLGFIRDLVFAHLFGASAATDAFFVAFKIPNFLRRLFAEGAFSVAFVPVLTEYKEKRGFSELKLFVDHVAGTLGVVVLAVTLLGVIGAPYLILVFAPGFIHETEKLLLASDMLRLTFPYLFFISLTALAGGILNAHNRFGVPAFTPVLLNLSMIACALWLSPLLQRPVVALAWGVLFAGIAQLLFQGPFLLQLKLLPRFRFAPKDAGVRRIGRLMLPALFGVSVTQINLLLDTLIASFLISGSISWLYYSDRLMEFPLGVLGVALGTVILPSLSRTHALESSEGFSQTIDWALRWALLLGMPAAVGLFVLSGPIISTLFQSKVFTAEDVALAQRSLMAYSLGLVSFILIKVLAPGYYARQDTRTPVRIAVIAMAANMGLNIILVFPLAHAGLALATTLSASLNAYLLWRGLCRQGVYLPQTGWPQLLLRVVAANCLLALALYWGGGALSEWTAAATWEKVWRLLGLVLCGTIVYVASLLLVGIRRYHFRGSTTA